MTPSKRVLIVEDAPDLRSLLCQLFESEGYRVSQAANGREALALLQAASELPQLILLDLMMPVMDGFAFRRAQAAQPRLAGIPVVIMTADGDPWSKQLRAGAADSLRKPVEVDELLEVIDRNLSIGASGETQSFDSEAR